MRSVPQNRCYRAKHRKGGAVTERARREYAEVVRPRYERADKQERGEILDEYCRTTGCHRKAAIRRLRATPRGPGRRPGRPPRYVSRELGPILERAGWPAISSRASSCAPSCPRCSRRWRPITACASPPRCERRSRPPARRRWTGCCARCAAGARASRGVWPPRWPRCARRCRCAPGAPQQVDRAASGHSTSHRWGFYRPVNATPCDLPASYLYGDAA